MQKDITHCQFRSHRPFLSLTFFFDNDHCTNWFPHKSDSDGYCCPLAPPPALHRGWVPDPGGGLRGPRRPGGPHGGEPSDDRRAAGRLPAAAWLSYFFGEGALLFECGFALLPGDDDEMVPRSQHKFIFRHYVFFSLEFDIVSF